MEEVARLLTFIPDKPCLNKREAGCFRLARIATGRVHSLPPKIYTHPGGIMQNLTLRTYWLILAAVIICRAADDWTQKSPSTKPSARDRHAMAYLGSGKNSET